MDIKEINFLPVYIRFFRYWWVPAVAAILGGSFGWLFSRTQTPLYEAKASIVVTVDFTQTGNLNAYNLDMAVGAIQAVLFSPDVLSQVQTLAMQRWPGFIIDDFIKNIGVERINETWILRVRNSDPEAAAILMNLWLDIGYQGLLDAHQHANTVKILQRYLNSLENCPPPPVIDIFVPPVCRDPFLIQLSKIHEIQNHIQQEMAKSYAIQPFLVFSRLGRVTIPEEPVMYQTKWLVTGGSLSFFLLAVLSLQLLPIKVNGSQTTDAD
jgi:hypothetical protein